MNEDTCQLAIELAESAPFGSGKVDFLINRPSEGVHVPVEELYLDVDKGIIGDRWSDTAWLRLPDGRPDPRVQVSLTNTKVMQCYTGSEADSVYRCGDNLYVDFNITEVALRVGDRIAVGDAILELSDVVNDACGKFSQRFGKTAFSHVRNEANASFRLRGVFCRIVQSGRVELGSQLEVVSARVP